MYTFPDYNSFFGLSPWGMSPWGGQANFMGGNLGLNQMGLAGNQMQSGAQSIIPGVGTGGFGQSTIPSTGPTGGFGQSIIPSTGPTGGFGQSTIPSTNTGFPGGFGQTAQSGNSGVSFGGAPLQQPTGRVTMNDLGNMMSSMPVTTWGGASTPMFPNYPGLSQTATAGGGGGLSISNTNLGNNVQTPAGVLPGTKPTGKSKLPSYKAR